MPLRLCSALAWFWFETGNLGGSRLQLGNLAGTGEPPTVVLKVHWAKVE